MPIFSDKYFSTVKWRYKIAFMFIAIIPVIIYFYYIFKYTVNVPVSDDYGIGLLFLNKFTDADFADKLKVLYAQHNEHRILFSKGIVLIDYWLEGVLDFKVLIIIGNVGLIAIAYALFKAIPKSYDKWLILIPISYFTFQLQHWENAGFGTACIQNTYVVFFCLYSIYLLDKQNKRDFILSISFAILATFTSGSGIITFIVGILPLALNRSYKKMIIWIICGLIVGGFYYHNLLPPTTGKGILQTLFEDTDKVLVSFFAFLGGSINFEKAWEPKTYDFTSSIVLGYLITLFFFYLLLIKYYKKDKILFSYFLLLFLTGAGLTVARVNLYTVDDFPTISRYKTISISLLIVSIIICLDLVRGVYKGIFTIGIILASMVYNYRGYIKNLPIFEIHNARLLKTSWLIYHQNDYSGIVDYDPPASEITLKNAEAKHIYKIPDLSDQYIKTTERSRLIQLELPSNSLDSLIEYQFDVIQTSDSKYFSIKDGWAVIKGRSSQGSQTFVVLKSKASQYIFTTQYVYRNDITENYHKSNPNDMNNYDNSGFIFSISAMDIKPDHYTVGIIIVSSDNKCHLQMSDQKIIIQ